MSITSRIRRKNALIRFHPSNPRGATFDSAFAVRAQAPELGSSPPACILGLIDSEFQATREEAKALIFKYIGAAPE